MPDFPRTLKGTCGSGNVVYHYELTLDTASEADPLILREGDRIIQAQARRGLLKDFVNGETVKINHKGQVYLTPVQIVEKMSPEQRKATEDAIAAVKKAEAKAKKAA